MSNESRARRHQILIEQVKQERRDLTDYLLSEGFDVDAIRNGNKRACGELADWIEDLREWAEMRDEAGSRAQEQSPEAFRLAHADVARRLDAMAEDWNLTPLPA